MLDADTLKRQLIAVQQCTTREDLDKLTRLLWPTYNTPVNAKALAPLRARIESATQYYRPQRPAMTHNQ